MKYSTWLDVDTSCWLGLRWGFGQDAYRYDHSMRLAYVSYNKTAGFQEGTFQEEKVKAVIS